MDEHVFLKYSRRLRRWMSIVLIGVLLIGLLSVAIYVLKPELLMSFATYSTPTVVLRATAEPSNISTLSRCI